jgi:hypothetical protein
MQAAEQTHLDELSERIDWIERKRAALPRFKRGNAF